MRKWFCAGSEGQERWEGPYNTREEAEQECLGYYADGGFVAEGRAVDPTDWTPSGEEFMERLEERAYDNGEGDPDGETFDVSSSALEELEKLIDTWARQNVTSHWYIVDGEKFMVLPRATEPRQ